MDCWTRLRGKRWKSCGKSSSPNTKRPSRQSTPPPGSANLHLFRHLAASIHRQVMTITFLYGPDSVPCW